MNDDYYIMYQCCKCKTTFIIPIEDMKRMELSGRTIACVFGHRSIRRVGKYGDLKECREQMYSRLI